MPTVRGHHHLAIQVKDLRAAERFYVEALGLPVVRRWPREDGPGERSVWLGVGAGEEFLALEACDAERPPAPFRDPRVLAAFERVPRPFFVPEEAQGEAEADRPLDIGHGQTISQPFIMAAMTEALHLEGRERVLEVGTGSGYQTAILCELLRLST